MVVRHAAAAPEFLYRVEIGRPVSGRPGLFRLTDHEVGTRLAYFIWGSTPDDALLDLADARGLSTPEAVRAAATRLLADPRARARVDRFHALWLGYHQLPHSADLTTAMRTETGALIDRVVFDERRPWTDVFTSGETYVDATLAELYGLPAPAEGFAWTPYPAGTGERRGILAHGSFLSVAGKFGDTSPTQRGKLIRERLLCESIPPPPPNVNVDQPPESPTSTCKYDRYEAHRANGSCSGCHSQMDPVGSGSEQIRPPVSHARQRSVARSPATACCSGSATVATAASHGSASSPRCRRERALEQVWSQVYRFAVGHREAKPTRRIRGARRRRDPHRFDDRSSSSSRRTVRLSAGGILMTTKIAGARCLGTVARCSPALPRADGRTHVSAAEPAFRSATSCASGQSLGADFDLVHDMYVPDTIGPTTTSLRSPLADFGNIKNEIPSGRGSRSERQRWRDLPGPSDDFTSTRPRRCSGVKSGGVPSTADVGSGRRRGSPAPPVPLARLSRAGGVALNVSAPFGAT
jgi:hypothetical protein